jgi:hypothetical protein
MTLFEFMPALWAILSFLFFAVYFLTDMRLFLLGCGGALFALCPALLGGGIFLQTVLFFAYIALVYAACFLKRLLEVDSAFRDAIALSAIDRRGGYILYKGRVRRAYPRDILYEYRLGDVLAVTELSNGTLCAYRI